MALRYRLSSHSLSTLLLVALTSFVLPGASGPYPLRVSVTQITSGPNHHLFGYIGQSRTIPWNASGRYILAIRTGFHDRLPGADDPGEVVVVDTERGNEVRLVDETRGWNHQQGTMFYWNPEAPETQFFFNDRDPRTGKIFTVLYDLEQGRRLREYRFPDRPVANSGVAQHGGAFLAINYGRMARLRPVTGYREAFDWTANVAAPEDDGIFSIDVASGTQRLLVSFRQLADALRPSRPDIDTIPLFINHTLWNRDDDRIWFFARGAWGTEQVVNVPFTIRPDGSGLTRHEHIGGHPEWGEGSILYGIRDGRQIVYDAGKREVVGLLGDADTFPDPEGDISLSPDGSFFVNGYRRSGSNTYVFYRMRDGVHVESPGLSCGGLTRGDLRIDAAPRWNRTGDAILVPGWTDEGTRQLHVMKIFEE